MMKKLGLTLGAGAAAVLAVSAVAPSASAETTLTAASCFPIGSPPSRPFEALVKEVNKQGAGVVKIDLKGGAPAIGSPFTLTQKMSKGAYDIVGCTEAYFGNVLPEAPAYRLTEKPYSELRRNGGWDYMAGLMAAKGIHMIARHHDFGKFYLWLNKKIDKPDLTGLHLRVAPVYTAFFESLGATTQSSNIAQIYTYMENGTVQGYGWPALGWVPSWVKVTKYRVEPGFYSATLLTMANLKKWKTLSADVQGVLTKVGMAFESKSEPAGPAFKALLDAQNAKTMKEGLMPIEFKGADREKWLSAAKKAAWGEVLEKSPEHGAKLQKLFTN